MRPRLEKKHPYCMEGFKNVPTHPLMVNPLLLSISRKCFRCGNTRNATMLRDKLSMSLYLKMAGSNFCRVIMLHNLERLANHFYQ